MAKKKNTEQQPNISLTDAQKRMDQYVKACETEKKGKITALSMIGVTILCLLILLIVGLRLNGIGYTVVKDESSGQVTVVNSAEVSGTALADTVTK